MHVDRRLILIGTAAVFLAIAILGCNRGETPAPSSTAVPVVPPWFADVTKECGINFVHDAGPAGTFFMPQILGSGAAVLDFDNDGRLDLYLVQAAGPNSKTTNRLYHQEPDGTFKDVTARSGLDITGYGMGVAVGDVNNDGLPDVLVTEYGRTRLFLNNGNGTFTDISKEAGIDNPAWGASAAFFDYDRDGWLDLIIVNYLDYDQSRRCTNNITGRPDFCPPREFKGMSAKLYHNLGVKSGVPRFEDVTERAGLGSQGGSGLGVVCADFTGDGWPDIFVANDAMVNFLWVNQRDGTFREEALGRGVAVSRMNKPEANMGIAYGDVDGDGLMDLFVTHQVDETNTLWRQGPRGFFKDQTVPMGLASPLWQGTGFGTVLADFTNGGTLHLAVANGRVVQPPGEPKAAFWSNYAQRNQLFVNQGKGVFQELSPHNPALCGTPGVWRALACADLNNDGALDLLVTQIAGPPRILRNIAPKNGHWLMVRALVSCQSSVVDGQKKQWRDAYGAEITVRAGERRWVRLLQPGYSYLCSNDPRVHVGLGPRNQVDEIQIVWPDGSKEAFPGVAADQFITLRQGEGKQP